MAQAASILIEVSPDGISWGNLALLPGDSVSYTHVVTEAGPHYYRMKALGDGIATLDSDYTATVAATTEFTAEYQAVLDFAAANGIGIPAINQNVQNDNIIRKMKSIGAWDKLDVFYYFQQDNTASYDFLLINWVMPAVSRLTNAGANQVAFVPSSGLKVSGSNNQAINTNFNPSMATKFKNDDYSIVFSTFDIPVPFIKVARLVSGYNDSASQINILNTADGLFAPRVANSAILPISLPQTLMNGQFHLSTKQKKRVYVNGCLISDQAMNSSAIPVNKKLYLFGTNFETQIPSEGQVGMHYFFMGAALSGITERVYAVFSHPTSTTTPGILKIADSSSFGFSTFYYPMMYNAAPFKNYFTGITKDYILLFSTNHAPSDASSGAIGWGQCDSPNMDGFQFMGIIKYGYQSETPALLINPNDPNGEHVWLFYHVSSTFPGATMQHTRLLTTPGGNLLHTAAYTDRGAVLGVTATEQSYTSPHTGYAVPYLEADGSIKAMHITKGWNADSIEGIPNLGLSTCPGNSYAFTRINSDIDITSFMPYKRQLHHSPSLFFERNGIQYAVARNASIFISAVGTNNFIGIWKCDGNYVPVSFWGNISGLDSGSNNDNAGYFIEGDVLYIYYIIEGTKVYSTTWDLTLLDT